MLKFVLFILRVTLLLAVGLVALIFMIALSGRMDNALILMIPVVLFSALFLFYQAKKAKRAQRQQRTAARSATDRSGPANAMSPGACRAIAAVDNRLSAAPVIHHRLAWLLGTGTWPQKLLNIAIIVLLVGDFRAMLFIDGFVLNPTVGWLSLLFSLGIALFTIPLWRYLVKRGRLVPKQAFYEASALKRWLLFLPAGICIVIMLFWFNLAMTLPHLYSSVAGETEIRRDVVVKDLGGRRTGCSYRLEPKSIGAFGFRYCISEAAFESLPETELAATLYLKLSPVGTIVERIELDDHDLSS